MANNNAQLAAASPKLCNKCHRRPPLAALSRCRECIAAGAEQDRQTRSAAEIRVAQRADAANLERQADTLLARDSHLMQQLGEHVQALESCYRELLQPRNDPEYVAALERRNEDLNQQANVTERVEHRVVKGKSEIVILPTNPRNTARGREAAVRVGRLFEAPVRYVEDPHDATRFADSSQKTPPKHTFGREKRSLGNGGGKQ
jgi:predicted nuclease with TOPRIM domain